jgi:hypothetical protein
METIQARLDPETRRALDRILRRTGWTVSRAVREGVLRLDQEGNGGSRRIVGLGAFASEVPDLGSNRRHLRGFGR